MNDSKFDKFFRDILKEHPSRLDTEKLLHTLETRLIEEKKRRKGIFWLWVGAGMLLVAFGMVWNSLFREMPEINEMNAAPVVEISLDGLREIIPATEIGSNLPPKANYIFGKRAVIPRISNPMHTEPGQIAASTNELHQRIFAAGQPAVLLSTTQSSPRPPDLETPEQAEYSLLMPDKLDVQSPLPAVVPEISSPEESSRDEWLSKQSRKARSYSGFLRVDVGSGLVQKDLSHRYDNAHGLLVARKETEKPLEYIGGALLGGFRHKSGIYVLSGLHYVRIQERFTYSHSHIERDTLRDGIIEITIGSGGDSTIVRGEVPFFRRIEYRKRSYSTYQLYDVPLIAGYEFSRNRWQISVEGGLLFNIALRANGDMLSENGEIIRIEASEMFKPRAGLGYTCALKLGFAAGDRTQVYIAPSWRFIPGSITEKEYGLKQSYNLPGVHIGVTRTL